MQDVAAFAAAKGIKPATVLQNAAGLSGQTWDKWQDGASCSLTTADRIRAYIAAKSQSKSPKSIGKTTSENAEAS